MCTAPLPSTLVFARNIVPRRRVFSAHLCQALSLVLVIPSKALFSTVFNSYHFFHLFYCSQVFYFFSVFFLSFSQTCVGLQFSFSSLFSPTILVLHAASRASVLPFFPTLRRDTIISYLLSIGFASLSSWFTFGSGATRDLRFTNLRFSTETAV